MHQLHDSSASAKERGQTFTMKSTPACTMRDVAAHLDVLAKRTAIILTGLSTAKAG